MMLFESQFGWEADQFYLNRFTGLMWDVFELDNKLEA